MSKIVFCLTPVYDASTKVPTGIITGNIQELGNLDQCLRVASAPDRAGQDVVKGQLCSTTVVFQISGFASNATDQVAKVPMSRSLLRKEKAADMKDLLLAVANAAVNMTWEILGWSGLACAPQFPGVFHVAQVCARYETTSIFSE